MYNGARLRDGRLNGRELNRSPCLAHRLHMPQPLVSSLRLDSNLGTRPLTFLRPLGPAITTRFRRPVLSGLVTVLDHSQPLIDTSQFRSLKSPPREQEVYWPSLVCREVRVVYLDFQVLPPTLSNSFQDLSPLLAMHHIFRSCTTFRPVPQFPTGYRLRGGLILDPCRRFALTIARLRGGASLYVTRWTLCFGSWGR